MKSSEEAVNGKLLYSQELLRVITAVKNGNFTERMPIDKIGLDGKVNDTLNQMISSAYHPLTKWINVPRFERQLTIK